MLWTFSIYLEAVAILPQLVLMQRTQNIDNLTGNYVFLLGWAWRGQGGGASLQQQQQPQEGQMLPVGLLADASLPATPSHCVDWARPSSPSSAPD